jgi:cilia- and flagella-associated protein 52
MTGQTTPDLINTGTVVRDYSCMTFSKNREDYLFAGSESGDFLAF